jgi:hypothetical protein
LALTHLGFNAEKRLLRDERVAPAGVVRHAVGRGSWSAHNRDEFARLAADAAPNEERALHRELTQVINAQRVSVDLPSPF